MRNEFKISKLISIMPLPPHTLPPPPQVLLTSCLFSQLSLKHKNSHQCILNHPPSFASVPPSFVIGLLLHTLLKSYYITDDNLLEHRELYEHQH